MRSSRSRVFICALITAAVLQACNPPAIYNSARHEIARDQWQVVDRLGQTPSDEAGPLLAELAAKDVIASGTFEEAVRQGRVVPGMSGRDVLLAWGKPSTARRPMLLGRDMVEHWVYKCVSPPCVVEFRPPFGDKVIDVRQSLRSRPPKSGRMVGTREVELKHDRPDDWYQPNP